MKHGTGPHADIFSEQRHRAAPDVSADRKPVGIRKRRQKIRRAGSKKSDFH
ncbi:MAG: hypothetical protein HPZ97_09085 [Oscillospiraceae bacterium]|nr:hypothetical protein [Oscillospiraceae bacterium]